MSQVILRSLEQIKDLIGGKKFLLVKDGAYDFIGIKEFFDSFHHAEFSEFTPNPLYEQVCRGVRLFNDEKCELIVAVGGGSTIDVAKCIKLFCKMNDNISYLEQEHFDTGIPFIAVPTTAGTGSESTRHAVIYNEGVKQSVSDLSIIPDYAVLMPSVLKTLPLYQKKCTMLDALCQAIESWWSVNSTDESKQYSKTAIAFIMAYWEEYIFENTDKASAKIMEAANYSGRAINITATTAPHAMSYKITSLYSLSHGHSVAICMPEVWKYMLEHSEACTDGRGTGYLRNTLSQISDMISPEQFVNMLEKMEMEYPKAIDKEAELELLVKSVNPVRLKNNPVALSGDALRDMYRRIVG